VSKLKDAAARVVAARNKPGGSWDDLKEAIGELEDVLKASCGSAPDDGGPAFACAAERRHQSGMSLRDYFAAEALSGYASQRLTALAIAANRITSKQVVEACYEWADLMLAARKEGGAK